MAEERDSVNAGLFRLRELSTAVSCALAGSAERFLSEGLTHEVLIEFFEALGGTTRLAHCSLFITAKRGDGCYIGLLLGDWIPDQGHQSSRAEAGVSLNLVDRWQEELHEGRSLAVRYEEIPPGILDRCRARGQGTLLLVPVVREGIWRATLAFEDDSSREWRSEETEVFTSAARVLGAALARGEVQEKLMQVSRCFLAFGPDPVMNINLITGVAGEILGSACALYNRLEGKMLCAIGQWHTPPDFEVMDTPQGHICYDVIRDGNSEPMIIRDLPNTRYAASDPNVRPYHLKTYIGKAVRIGEDFVGSLCVVYQDDVVPTELDRQILTILAGAIGIEEERRQADALLLATIRDLRHSNKDLAEFTRAISHDLRSPLRAIGSLSSWLATDLSGCMDDTSRKNLALIQERVARMERVISGLDLYASVRRPEGPLPIIDITPLVQEVIEEIAPDRGIKVEVVGSLPRVAIDPGHARLVFYHLIENAVRFIGRPVGEVTITGNTLKARAAFAVKDNGPGIDPRYIEKIFSPFQTLQPKDARESTGIGLAITRKVIELYDGEISVDSAIGAGSTFLFSLPATSGGT
ncbi:MAG: ATP-binding protein [Methanomicrobiales archaeon]|nr:ATP-binding protein [Methanomicrobiales archaeon]